MSKQKFLGVPLRTIMGQLMLVANIDKVTIIADVDTQALK